MNPVFITTDEIDRAAGQGHAGRMPSRDEMAAITLHGSIDERWISALLQPLHDYVASRKRPAHPSDPVDFPASVRSQHHV